MARRRYEALFERNVRAQRAASSARSLPGPRPRKAAGWRGLSVDLLTSPELGPVADTPAVLLDDAPVTADARLAGEVVRRIWTCSRLGRPTLRAIWVECDPARTGTLDREGFVRGMWRVDEELRRAQLVGAGRSGNAFKAGLGRHASNASVRTGGFGAGRIALR